MKTVVRSRDLKDFLSVREFPDGFGVPGLVKSSYEVGFANVRDVTHEIMLNGICIEQRRVTAPDGYTINVQHDFPFLKMHFELEGYSFYNNQVKGSLDVEVPGGRHMLMFLPEVKGDLHYTSNRNTLEIKLTIGFLRQIFEDDLEILKHFGKGIDGNTPVLLYNRSLPLTPKMIASISDIMHCPYTGTIARAFIEAKVIELLILQLDQFTESEKYSRHSAISHGDISRLDYVREIIHSDCSKPLSLKQLSVMSGLNIFKLKKGFKELYNTTVFGYITDTRMDTALRLLQQQGLPIADIANQVGYKNPQHFTTAFKRKFGFLPSRLR